MINEIKELMLHMENHDVISTHSHHLTEHFYDEVSLFSLMQMTYISWICPPFTNDNEGINQYFKYMGANSYFTWWKRAVESLYGDGEKLSPKTWNFFDNQVKICHKEKAYPIQLLKEKCRYTSVILDDYQNPGSNHGCPELFTPTFRCDMFLCGNVKDATDENHNNAYRYFEVEPTTLKEYVEQTKKVITKKKAEGIVALKIAIAYERSLVFKAVSYEQAQKEFHNGIKSEKVLFGDYMMFEIAKIAAELNIPIQIHTGLGILKQSRAIGLRDLIAGNPDTRFVIFHGSYPWSDDVLGLAHNYKNVYVDLCWLPLISTSRSVSFLKEALEITDASRLMWGCDTWTGEESYGAVLAIKHCISKSLAQLIDEEAISLEYAKFLASNILHDNAASLYNIK